MPIVLRIWGTFFCCRGVLQVMQIFICIVVGIPVAWQTLVTCSASCG